MCYFHMLLLCFIVEFANLLLCAYNSWILNYHFVPGDVFFTTVTTLVIIFHYCRYPTLLPPSSSTTVAIIFHCCRHHLPLLSSSSSTTVVIIFHYCCDHLPLLSSL